MALHLNLNHEIQQQKRAQKRDPLRLGMYALALIVLGFIGYYALRLTQVSEVTSRLAGVESEWRSLEPKKKAAEERQTELTTSASLSDALVQQIEGRFYWGPVLENLMEAVPPEVQLTRLEAGRTPEKSKNISVVLSGISTGPEPRRTAEDTRTSLEQKLATENMKVNSSFKVLEDGEDKARLKGGIFPTANFTIELELVLNEPPVVKPLKHEAKK